IQNLTESEIEVFLRARADEQFLLDLDRYVCWIHGNIYDVTVCTDNYSGARISKTLKHCYKIKDFINFEVSDAATSIIDAINNIDGSLKVTLQMDISKFASDYIGHITDGIYQEFQFAFTLGSTKEDYNTGEVSLVLLPHEIPTFQDLVNRSGFHLIRLMQKHTVDADGNETHGAWETVNMLMSLPFHEWSDVMQIGLLNTLFDSLYDIKLINTEPVGKPKEKFGYA
ncbi:MAG: hypothetical protein J6N68_09120, partial [Shewanella sp.]|nr:hypothetical protein [Shewanella sp.]